MKEQSPTPTTATIYFVHDNDMGGDATVMLYNSEKEFTKLSEEERDAAFIGQLTNDDADKMSEYGIDCTDERQCIEYGKTFKGFAVPENYNIETDNAF